MRFFEDTPLPAGLAAVKQEQARLDAEITAFEEFTERIADIDLQQTSGSPTSTPPIAHGDQSQVQTAPSVEVVRTAYAETVLEVDHWADAYEETTVDESLPNEFSTDIAEVLTTPDATVSPPLYYQLRTEAQHARETRHQTHDQLAEEAAQLRHVRDQLDTLLDTVSPVERGTESFDDRVNRLASATESLETLAQSHQEYVQQRNGRIDQMVTDFVYAGLNTSYPGLATLGQTRAVLDRLELRLWAGLL